MPFGLLQFTGNIWKIDEQSFGWPIEQNLSCTTWRHHFFSTTFEEHIHLLLFLVSYNKPPCYKRLWNWHTRAWKFLQQTQYISHGSTLAWARYLHMTFFLPTSTQPKNSKYQVVMICLGCVKSCYQTRVKVRAKVLLQEKEWASMLEADIVYHHIHEHLNRDRNDDTVTNIHCTSKWHYSLVKTTKALYVLTVSLLCLRKSARRFWAWSSFAFIGACFFLISSKWIFASLVCWWASVYSVRMSSYSYQPGQRTEEADSQAGTLTKYTDLYKKHDSDTDVKLVKSENTLQKLQIQGQYWLLPLGL